MTLEEASEKVKRRSFPMAYEGMAKSISPNGEAEEILAQANADIIAIRCMEAQKRLNELLNDLMKTDYENNTYSGNLVVDMLSIIRFDAKFDKDGAFDSEATWKGGANDRDSDNSKSDNS